MFKIVLLAAALSAAAGAVADTEATTRVVLRDDSGREVHSYAGALYVNTRQVALRPALRAAVEGEALVQAVCGFRLHPRGARLPLRLRLRDPTAGTADLRVDADALALAVAGVNGSLPRYYDFDVSAFDCESPAHESRRVPVLLRVDNFERPRFLNATRVAEVAAGAGVGTEVLRLRAVETEASVCRYSIGTPAAAPFDIDGNGVIRAKEQLPASPRKYHLSVIATDCAVPVPRSSTAVVEIRLLPAASNATKVAAAAAKEETTTEEVCQANWSGIGRSFVAGQSAQTFFAAGASLSECRFERLRCEQTEAEVKVSVRGDGRSRECDRRQQSQQQLQRVCGASDQSVDLLHSGAQPKEARRQKRPPAGCRRRRDDEGDRPPTLFDGKATAVTVPDSVIGRQHELGDKFALHFWLQHGRMPTRAKEQILCSADTRHHNRHHYSVFLHNCKLILLLRQEPLSGDGRRRRREAPAEWRFPLRQVCDARWHHYSLLRSGDSVQLLVDGLPAAQPQVLYDTPLRSDTAAGGTVLTVGACWHSASGTHRQLLRGSLAAPTLLRRGLESPPVLRCLADCGGRLQFKSNGRLPVGASVADSADGGQLTLRADTADIVGRMLRSVAFVAAGARPQAAGIRIRTSVQCRNARAQLKVPTVEVSVSAPAPAAVCIGGHSMQRVAPQSVSSPEGVAVVSDLEIDQPRRQLRTCSLRTAPKMTAVESLEWPAPDAADAGIRGRATSRQLLLDGEAPAAEYQSILRRVRYRNVNPIIQYRTFTVSCEAAAGGGSSNQHVVKLAIFHPPAASKGKQQQQQQQQQAPADKAKMQAVLQHRQHHEKQQQHFGHFAESDTAAVAGASLHRSVGANDDNDAVSAATIAAPAVVGVVSLGLVLLVLALAIYRLRSRQGQQQLLQPQRQLPPRGGKALHVDAESQQEMEWDNAGLNITVNPLDGQETADTAALLPGNSSD